MTLLEEALHYSFFTVTSINQQRANSKGFQENLNNSIDNIKADAYYETISFEELVILTIRFTQEAIVEDTSSEDLYDKNSVAWHMGIYCYIWRNSIEMLNGKFDEIFKASWVRYFSELIQY